MQRRQDEEFTKIGRTVTCKILKLEMQNLKLYDLKCQMQIQRWGGFEFRIKVRNPV